MDYQLIEDDVFEWDGDDYIVLDIYEYNDSRFYFVNKLINEEEPSKEFIVFKELEDGLIKFEDKEVLDVILPVFSTNMNKKIEYLNLYNKEGEI